MNKVKLSNTWKGVWNHVMGMAVLVLVLLLFEYNYLYETLINFWVSPLASRISDEPISLACLTILIIGVIYWIHQKKKHGVILLFLYLFVAVFTILVRTNDSWNINPSIGHIILFSTAILFLLFIFEYFVNVDIPETQIEINDDFERRKLSEKIVDNLLADRIINESFNFCLLGKWGSGKTHMFKLIKHEIQRRPEYGKQLFLFEYSPWEHSSSEDLERSLLEELAHSENPELSSIFKDLSNLFYEYNSKYLPKAGVYLMNKMFGPSESVHTRLKKFLKHKHIIILFDDIDRLDREEIRSTLKIIRNTLDYKNIHFGVGFDRDYLGRTLFRTDLKLKKNPTLYLDKFFQLKIDIPTAINLKKYFLKFFSSEFSERDAHPTYSKVSKLFEQSKVLKMLKTPRDIENVIYSAQQMHIGVEDSTDLLTIILLETIKLIEPNTYKKGKERILSKTKFEKIEDIVPVEMKEIVSYSKDSRYPLDTKYYRNYFDSTLGTDQINPKQLIEIFENENSREGLKTIRQLIDRGYGQDIFQRISWLLKDDKFSYSKEHVELVVKAYEYYQPEINIPYNDLVEDIFRYKETDKYLEYIYNSVELNYYYKLSSALMEKNAEIETKVIQIISEAVEKESNSLNNHLFYLVAQLDIKSRGSINFYTNRKIKSLKLSLNNFLKTIVKQKPWYFLVNFIHEISRHSPYEEGKRDYMIYKEYIPSLISFEELELILPTRMDQYDALDQKNKDEIMVFLSGFMLGKSLNGELSYEFSRPEIFRNVISEADI